jgi:hypothetical protein
MNDTDPAHLLESSQDAIDRIVAAIEDLARSAGVSDDPADPFAPDDVPAPSPAPAGVRPRIADGCS